MSTEQWQEERQLTIAQMAATIYAGRLVAAEAHNASSKTEYTEFDRGPRYDECAKDATRLFDAVGAGEGVIAQAQYTMPDPLG